MSLKDIAVVLVRTTHPGNIGATARAMANMGLTDLRLVDPVGYPGQEATARAVGASELLEQASVYTSLDDAISDAGFVVGATARPRRIAWPCSEPEAAMRIALGHSTTTNIAILFGREASGLTNEELDRCHLHVRIPVDDRYPSLNLASAVLIFCYELRRLSIDEEISIEDHDNTETVLARAGQVNDFFGHLEAVLHEIEFLKYPSSRLLRRIKRIFSKRPLEAQEVNILRGILTSVQHACRNSENTEKHRS